MDLRNSELCERYQKRKVSQEDAIDKKFKMDRRQICGGLGLGMGMEQTKYEDKQTSEDKSSTEMIVRLYTLI